MGERILMFDFRKNAKEVPNKPYLGTRKKVKKEDGTLGKLMYFKLK